MLVTLFASETEAHGIRATLEGFDALREMLSDVVVSAQKTGQRGWSPATFRDEHRRLEKVEAVHALVLDIDVPELPGRLPAALSYVAHRTYSGNWRLVIELSRPYSKAEHAPLREAVMAEFGIDETLGPSQAADPSRFYFGPCVPEASRFEVRNNRGAPLDVDEFLATVRAPTAVPEVAPAAPAGAETPGTESSPVPGALLSDEPIDLQPLADAVKRARGAKPETLEFLRSIVEGRFVLKKGNRDNELHRGAAIIATMLEPEPTKEYASKLGHLLIATLGPEVAPEGYAHWHDKWMFSFERGINHRREEEDRRIRMERAFFPPGHHPAELARAAAKGEPPPPPLEEGAPGAWRLKLLMKQVGKNQVIQPVGFNVETILTNDERLKGLVWDVVQLQPKWLEGPLKDVPGDALDTALSNWLAQSEYHLNVSAQLCAQNLYLVARRTLYDPVSLWLKSLVWDGTHRVHGLLENYFQLEGHNPRYAALISEKWMVGAVARALQPGCQMDTTLLLADNGEGGQGKTTFARILGGEWYGKLDGAIDKDALMKVAGKWIVEFAEMASSKRTDREHMRAFLTDTVDRFRPPYGRTVQEFPRRAVFVATSNDETPIQDAMGARRYWPIRVYRNLKREELARDREQLFAEAVALYRDGERWWLSPDEESMARTERGVMLEPDFVVEAICEWVRKMPPEQRPERVNVNDFLQKTMLLSSSEAARMWKSTSQALRSAGWEKMRSASGALWKIPDKVRYFGLTRDEVLGRKA